MCRVLCTLRTKGASACRSGSLAEHLREVKAVLQETEGMGQGWGGRQGAAEAGELSVQSKPSERGGRPKAASSPTSSPGLSLTEGMHGCRYRRE